MSRKPSGVVWGEAVSPTLVPDIPPPTEARLPHAINGTEMRLDALIDEMKALSGELRAIRQALAPQPPAETIELREPAKPIRKRATR